MSNEVIDFGGWSPVEFDESMLKKDNVVAWYIPVLLTFKNAKFTSCPKELVPEMEGNVVWAVSLFNDDERVVDKFGVEHKPRPLIFGD